MDLEKIVKDSVRSRAQAKAAAIAVNNARVLCAVALGRVNAEVDRDLYDLEMAYWKLADEKRKSALSDAAGQKTDIQSVKADHSLTTTGRWV